jgi:hypothetical protein
VQIELDPKAVETSYGGPEEHRGRVDVPLRLQTLVLLAPNRNGGSIKLGRITRNAFNPDDISIASRLARVEIDLQRQGGIPLVRADHDEPVRLTLNNAGSAEAAFDLQLTFEHFDGTKHEWSLAAFEGTAAGEPGREVEIAARLFNPTTSEATYALHWTVSGNPPQTQTLTVPAGETQRQAIRISMPPAVKSGDPPPGRN